MYIYFISPLGKGGKKPKTAKGHHASRNAYMLVYVRQDKENGKHRVFSCKLILKDNFQGTNRVCSNLCLLCHPVSLSYLLALLFSLLLPHSPIYVR